MFPRKELNKAVPTSNPHSTDAPPVTPVESSRWKRYAFIIRDRFDWWYEASKGFLGGGTTKNGTYRIAPTVQL